MGKNRHHQMRTPELNASTVVESRREPESAPVPDAPLSLADRVDQLEDLVAVLMQGQSPALPRCRCGRFATRVLRMHHHVMGMHDSLTCDACDHAQSYLATGTTPIEEVELQGVDTGKLRRFNATLERAKSRQCAKPEPTEAPS